VQCNEIKNYSYNFIFLFQKQGKKVVEMCLILGNKLHINQVNNFLKSQPDSLCHLKKIKKNFLWFKKAIRILKIWKIIENNHHHLIILLRPLNHLKQLKEILPNAFNHTKYALKLITETHFNPFRPLRNHLNSLTKIWLRKYLLKELRTIRIYRWAFTIS